MLVYNNFYDYFLYFQVKAYRTWVVVKQVLGVHLLISWLYFCVFPERYGKEQESKSLFMKFVGTTLPTILGWNGMFFLFTLSLTVQMFMIQLTSKFVCCWFKQWGEKV